MSEYRETYEIQEDDYWRRVVLAALSFAAQAIYFFLMAAAAIAKIFEFGVHPYIMHYTNWSWTFQLLFYGTTLAATFVQQGFVHPHSALGSFTRTIIVLAFFPLLGVVVVVATLVWVLLGTNSPFITDIFDRVPAQIVIIGNDVFHVIPVLAIVIYFVVLRKIILYSLNSVAAEYGLTRNPCQLLTFLAYEGFFGTALSLGSYALIFDAQEVYQTEIETFYGIILSAVTLAFSSFLAIVIVAALLRVVSSVHYPLGWLVRNDSDPRQFERSRDVEPVEPETRIFDTGTAAFSIALKRRR